MSMQRYPALIAGTGNSAFEAGTGARIKQFLFSF